MITGNIIKFSTSITKFATLDNLSMTNQYQYISWWAWTTIILFYSRFTVYQHWKSTITCAAAWGLPNLNYTKELKIINHSFTINNYFIVINNYHCYRWNENCDQGTVHQNKWHTPMYPIIYFFVPRQYVCMVQYFFCTKICPTRIMSYPTGCFKPKAWWSQSLVWLTVDGDIVCECVVTVVCTSIHR